MVHREVAGAILCKKLWEEPVRRAWKVVLHCDVLHKATQGMALPQQHTDRQDTAAVQKRTLDRVLLQKLGGSAGKASDSPTKLACSDCSSDASSKPSSIAATASLFAGVTNLSPELASEDRGMAEDAEGRSETVRGVSPGDVTPGLPAAAI